MTNSRQKFTPYLLLLAVWLISRIPLILHTEIWPQWAAWQARKLLEYGFLERAGALTPTYFMTGHLPYIQDLNYTNHPYPIVWLYTALYAVAGWRGCLAVMLILRLSSSLICFHLLQRVFSKRAAFLATLAYMVAPAALAMEMETNIIGIAASLWPFGVLIAIQVAEGQRRPVWLGLFVLCGAQISWFFLAIVPALSFLAAPGISSLRDFLRKWWQFPGPRWVALGALLGAAIFLLQL